MAIDFGSLTSAFTGQPVIDANAQARDFLSSIMAQNQANLGKAGTAGLGDIRAGVTGGVGAVAPAITLGRGDISSSVGPAVNALYGGQGSGVAALSGAVDPAIAALYGSLGDVRSAYAPLSTIGGQFQAAWQPASTMSADALGLNGPEGVDRATAAFRSSPGYNFALNQGLESILRNANAAGGGNVYGGNLLRESQTYGQGLADQDYKNWLASIAQREQLYGPLASSAFGTVGSGIGNAALTAGTGAANTLTGTAGRLADLYSGTAGRVAPIYTGAGTSLADLAKTGGLTTASLLSQGGQAEADLRARIAGAQSGAAQQFSQPIAKTYTDAAAAEVGGSKNLWNLIGQLATAGTSLAGGGGLASLGQGVYGLLNNGAGYYGGSPATNPLLRPV